MNNTTDNIMTVKEVADYLRVNQRTVYRLAVDGRDTWLLKLGPTGVSGRYRRVDAAQLAPFVAASDIHSGE